MRMRVCYLLLDCHDAGLCCYLVIHTENLLHPYSRFTPICDVFTDSPSYMPTDMMELLYPCYGHGSQ
jgi:hypothetical protein